VSCEVGIRCIKVPLAESGAISAKPRREILVGRCCGRERRRRVPRVGDGFPLGLGDASDSNIRPRKSRNLGGLRLGSGRWLVFRQVVNGSASLHCVADSLYRVGVQDGKPFEVLRQVLHCLQSCLAGLRSDRSPTFDFGDYPLFFVSVVYPKFD